MNEQLHPARSWVTLGKSLSLSEPLCPLSVSLTHLARGQRVNKRG